MLDLNSESEDEGEDAPANVNANDSESDSSSDSDSSDSSEDEAPQQIDIENDGPVQQEIPKKCTYCYQKLINGTDIIRTNCPGGFHHYFHEACFEHNNRSSPGKCPQGPGSHRYDDSDNIGPDPNNPRVGGGYRKNKKRVTRRINRKGRKGNVSIKGKIREVKITRKGNITIRGNIYGVKVGKRKSRNLINRNLINRNLINRNLINRNKRVKLTRKMINRNIKLSRRLINRNRNNKIKKSRKMLNRNKFINKKIRKSRRK